MSHKCNCYNNSFMPCSQENCSVREWEAYHRSTTFWYKMLKFSYLYKLRNTRMKWPDVQFPFWNFKCICVCMHTTRNYSSEEQRFLIRKCASSYTVIRLHLLSIVLTFQYLAFLCLLLYRLYRFQKTSLGKSGPIFLLLDFRWVLRKCWVKLGKKPSGNFKVTKFSTFTLEIKSLPSRWKHGKVNLYRPFMIFKCQASRTTLVYLVQVLRREYFQKWAITWLK